MSMYRKKPVEVEARQNIYPSAGPALAVWCAGKYDVTSRSIYIPTLEGVMECGYNDWIIQGVQGEFYPCKPNIFEATYEAVSAAEFSTEH